MKRLIQHALGAAVSALLANAAYAAPPGPPVTEPIDVTVTNTVETTVANTVDANVVNTLPANLLLGVDFGPGAVTGATVSWIKPVSIHAISTSIAPDVPGELCNVSVEIKSDNAADLQPIGLSVMSNGQAATVSRNYEIPLESLTAVNFELTGNATICRLSLSLSYTLLESPEAATASDVRSLAGQDLARIEIR